MLVSFLLLHVNIHALLTENKRIRQAVSILEFYSRVRVLIIYYRKSGDVIRSVLTIFKLGGEGNIQDNRAIVVENSARIGGNTLRYTFFRSSHNNLT